MGSDTEAWRFLLSPPAAWDAMLEDCRQATQSIEFEQYILEDDPVGKRFLDVFIDKARRGLKVCLILDKFGSATIYNSPLIKQLRDVGGRVYFYNVIYFYDIFRPWRWFPRTHIKTMLIDSRIAYTGGVCVSQHMTDWRDTQIRVTGPITTQFREAFDRAESLIKRKKLSGYAGKEVGKGDFVYLQSAPVTAWHIIYGELVRAIGQAKHSIYISTPFFAPNRRFRLLLRGAARRGIDVRLLVTGHSDVAMADWVCLSYAPKLLKAGARIFRYQNSVMHDKAVVIDDDWATIGSTNMDVLSFFRNRESNLVIRNKDAIAEMKKQFLVDLQHSAELTAEELAKEPYWKIAAGYVARLLKSFLWRT
jgi:cardiolipin synthase